MAVGGSNIANGLVSSLTGTANKAYILFRNPDNLPDDKGEGIADGIAGLAKMADSMMQKADSLTAKSGKMGFSAMFGTDDALLALAGSNDYIPMKVQYNPSSMNFSGRAGEIRNESAGGSNEGSFQRYNAPEETILSMELMFDDVNVMDAFMVNSSVASVQGIGDVAGQLINAGLGKEYSVQDISEVFVAAMLNSYTRMVGFVWNKTIFWGELTSVNVQFTMFNKKGNPIRSKVYIQIRQDKKNGETRYATEKNWEKAYENMFKVKNTNTAFNINNAASNIFNLN